MIDTAADAAAAANDLVDDAGGFEIEENSTAGSMDADAGGFDVDDENNFFGANSIGDVAGPFGSDGGFDRSMLLERIPSDSGASSRCL
jgi:hypothetical protein